MTLFRDLNLPDAWICVAASSGSRLIDMTSSVDVGRERNEKSGDWVSGQWNGLARVARPPRHPSKLGQGSHSLAISTLGGSQLSKESRSLKTPNIDPFP